MKIDRSEASRALAKAIAYKDCGKDAEAENWAQQLVEILRCSNILREPVARVYTDAGGHRTYSIQREVPL